MIKSLSKIILIACLTLSVTACSKQKPIETTAEVTVTTVMETSEVAVSAEQTEVATEEEIVIVETELNTEAETTEEEPEDNSDYLIAGSDSRYVFHDELVGFTKEELRIARNEIFARHGRKFKSDDLQEYFNQKSWYKTSIEADDFDESILNEYEKENIKTIKAMEDGETTAFYEVLTTLDYKDCGSYYEATAVATDNLGDAFDGPLEHIKVKISKDAVCRFNAWDNELGKMLTTELSMEEYLSERECFRMYLPEIDSQGIIIAFEDNTAG